MVAITFDDYANVGLDKLSGPIERTAFPKIWYKYFTILCHSPCKKINLRQAVHFIRSKIQNIDFLCDTQRSRASTNNYKHKLIITPAKRLPPKFTA